MSLPAAAAITGRWAALKRAETGQPSLPMMRTRHGRNRTPSSCFGRWQAFPPILALIALSSCACALQLSDRPSATEHFKHASVLAKEHRITEAEHEYRLGLQIDPTSIAAYNNLGVLYFATGDFQQAADAFGRAHRLHADDPEISFNLGLALFKSGNCPNAIAPLRAGAVSPRHATDAHYLLGACYFELKQWQKSIQELEAARKARPKDDKILFLLFNDYRNIGKPTQSLRAAADLLKNSPDSPLVYEILGEARDAEGQSQQAEQEFKQAIAAAPRAPELHFLLGYLYWRWKRYQEALAPLKTEIRINPSFAPPYYYLGDITLRQGNPRQALDYFRKVLRLDPSYSLAALGTGRADARLGKYEESIRYFRQAVQKMPGDAEPHYWLGRTLIRAGQAEEGKKELAEFHRIQAARDASQAARLRSAAKPAPATAGAPQN